MAWRPEIESLRQLTGYLKDALGGHDQNAQRHATMLLIQAKSSPDIVNYLTYILSNGELLETLQYSSPDLILVRSSAALSLKNTVKSTYRSIPEASRAYIRTTVLACLEDPNLQIRNFAGSVITEMVQRGGVSGWPDLLQSLLTTASHERDNTPKAAKEGAMSALLKVCEDNRKEIGRSYGDLKFLLQNLLKITSHSIPRIRALALASINAFIPQKPGAVLELLNEILGQLIQLANDQSDDVRRNVCRSFVLIVDIEPASILPHMAGLVEYMTLQQRNNHDPDLALEAAEFWLAISENDKMCTALGPYLDMIVPVLLESMVYDEEAMMRLESYRDDADVEDRAEDIKPQFGKSKTARSVANGRNMTDDANGASGHLYKPLDPLASADEDALSEGELEEDDAEDDADIEEQWNLRKCSAAALDVLASTFHGVVFNTALPYLKENLVSQDWSNREAAVLAIGAVAEGCMSAITPHLPELIPYLISSLADKEPAVRVITCWALGRYSGWASHLENPAGKTSFFEPMMEGILSRMLDTNKRVQESAASAFANLEERAGKELTPYCSPIIHQFVRCFDQYKDRNMLILYDCVQTLAEQVGPPLRSQDLVDGLMPAIIKRWSKVSDESQELFPLLECLSYVATALGDTFAPFAIPIFTRCIRIIHQNLQQYLLAVQNEPMDKPDKDFLVTSIDLLSAIIQALEPAKSGELVASSQPRFFELLSFCMEDPSNDVRQSSYALLGDCAVNIFFELQPFLPSLIPILIRQLDLDNLRDDDADTGFSVINNACWSCGEIAMKYKQEMAPFVGKIYQSLASIMNNPQVPTSVSENAVIALGRLGVDSSQILAPRLADFARPFLQIIEPVETNDEKGHALLGFNRTIEKNPHAMEGCLLEYFRAGIAYKKDDLTPYHQEETVGGSFQRNLAGYRSLIPDFDAFVGQLSPPDQARLRASYDL